MTEIIEGQHKAEFIVTEANGSLSRENATIVSGQSLQPGHILGKVTVGTASGAAVSGNTGNGTITTVSAGDTAKAGIYQIICIEPGTNLGTFSVENPNGVVVGRAIVGAAFAGEVNFTINDGATDFVAGDRFTVTVAEGSGKYKEYNPANTDGSQVASAILIDFADATAGDCPGVVIARHAEVNKAELIWFTGANDAQKEAGLTELRLYDIIAR
jgi:hypothetical protein